MNPINFQIINKLYKNKILSIIINNHMLMMLKLYILKVM